MRLSRAGMLAESARRYDVERTSFRMDSRLPAVAVEDAWDD